MPNDVQQLGSPPPPLDSFVRQLVAEVVSQIDVTDLVEPKLAYTTDEVAVIAGFTNGLAVEREIRAGRLIACKVRNKLVVRRERLIEYLIKQEDLTAATR